MGNNPQLAFNDAFADLPLYDERLAESLAASNPNVPSQVSFIPGEFAMPPNSIGPPNFTGFVFLGDTCASDEPRGKNYFVDANRFANFNEVIPPKLSRRKSVKQMRQQVQAGKEHHPPDHLDK